MGERTDELSGRNYSSNAEDRKRSDQIRDDIHRTQREIGNTVDDIQYRLSPDRLRHQASDYLRNAPERASRGLMDKIRENPVPAAIAGLGLWMFFRSGNSDSQSWESSYRSDSPRYGYGYGSRYGTGYDNSERFGDFDDGRGMISTAKEKVGEMGDKLGDVADSAKEKTSEAMHHLGDKAGELRYQARRQAGRARDEFWDVLNGNPLALGAAGVAIGAILGASLPVTEKENELLGETRDRLMDKAKDVASEGVDRAKEVARAATEAGKDEAKHQAESMSDGSLSASSNKTTPPPLGSGNVAGSQGTTGTSATTGGTARGRTR